LLGAQGIKQVLKNTGEYALEEITGLPNPKDVADLVKTGKRIVKNADEVIKITIDNLTQESVNYKLTTYFSEESHPAGGDKAKWFKSALGYTKENYDELAKQIIL
jgi:hypothetical protein